MAGTFTIIAAGGIFLGVGIFLAMTNYGRDIWYPFVLLGALDIIVFGAVLVTLRQRYRDAEERRMLAMDLQ